MAVGRAMMLKPKVLMMDEPSLGLAPLLVKDIFAIIKEIHRQLRGISSDRAIGFGPQKVLSVKAHSAASSGRVHLRCR